MYNLNNDELYPLIFKNYKTIFQIINFFTKCFSLNITKVLLKLYCTYLPSIKVYLRLYYAVIKVIDFLWQKTSEVLLYYD